MPQQISVRQKLQLQRYGTFLDPNGYSYGQYPDGNFVKQYTFGASGSKGSEPTWIINRVN